MKSQFYKWTSAIVLIIASFSTYAQDLIIKNDKTEIKAKILEIGDNDVKYKKKENPTGPTYSVSKSNIMIIIYSNGEKETFPESQIQQKQAPTQVVKQSATSPQRTTTKKTVQQEVEYEVPKKTSNIEQQTKNEDVNDKDLALAKAINFTKANRLIYVGTNLTTLSNLGLNAEFGSYTPLPIIKGNENIFLGTNFNFTYANQTTLGIKSQILGFGGDITLNYRIAIPDNNKLTIFGGAGLLYTSSIVTLDTKALTGSETVTSISNFGLVIKGNVNYFLTPSIGIYGTIITGTSGGVAFAAGVALRKAPKK